MVFSSQVTLFVSRMDASGVSCQWPLAKSPHIQTYVSIFFSPRLTVWDWARLAEKF